MVAADVHSGSLDARELVTAPGRWIQQEGAIVRFRLGPAPFWGPLHVHHLASPSIADRLIVALKRMDMENGTAALDPEEWASWQGESAHGSV